MNCKTFLTGLASASILLGLLSGTHAFPKLLQPNIGEVEDSKFAPRGYNIYERDPQTYGGYSYYGSGPAPTISSGSSLDAAASSNSGGETSLSNTQTLASTIYGTTSSSLSSGSSPVSTGSSTSSAVGIFTSLSTSSFSSPYEPTTPSTLIGGGEISSTTSGQAASSQSAPTNNMSGQTTVSSTTSTPHLSACNHDNCLRQLMRSSTAGFCASFTAETYAATTGLPDFVSKCMDSPSRISSACSCLTTGVGSTFSFPTSAPIVTYSTTASLPSSSAELTSSGIGIATSLPQSPSNSAPSSSVSSREGSTIFLTTTLAQTVTTSASGQIFSSSLETASTGGGLPSSSLSSVIYPNSTSSTTISVSGSASSTPALGLTLSLPTTAPYQPTNSSTFVRFTSLNSGVVTSRTSSRHYSKSKSRTYSSIIPTGTLPYSSGLSSGVISSSSPPPYPLNSTSNAIGATGVASSGTGSTISLTSVITVTRSTSSVASLGTSVFSQVSLSAILSLPSTSIPYPVYNTTSSIAGIGTAPHSTSSSIPLNTGASRASLSSTLSFQSSSSVPYPIHNTTSSGIGISLIGTAPLTTVTGGISTSSGLGASGTAPYTMSNSTTTAGPTGTESHHHSKPKTESNTRSSKSRTHPSHASGGLTSIMGASSVPYPTYNQSSVILSTGSGILASSSSSSIGPLSTGLSSASASMPYPTTNQTSLISPTGSAATSNGGFETSLSSFFISTSSLPNSSPASQSPNSPPYSKPANSSEIGLTGTGPWTSTSPTPIPETTSCTLELSIPSASPSTGNDFSLYYKSSTSSLLGATTDNSGAFASLESSSSPLSTLSIITSRSNNVGSSIGTISQPYHTPPPYYGPGYSYSGNGHDDGKHSNHGKGEHGRHGRGRWFW